MSWLFVKLCERIYVSCIRQLSKPLKYSCCKSVKEHGNKVLIAFAICDSSVFKIRWPLSNSYTFFSIATTDFVCYIANTLFQRYQNLAPSLSHNEVKSVAFITACIEFAFLRLDESSFEDIFRAEKLLHFLTPYEILLTDLSRKEPNWFEVLLLFFTWCSLMRGSVRRRLMSRFSTFFTHLFFYELRILPWALDKTTAMLNETTFANYKSRLLLDERLLLVLFVLSLLLALLLCIVVPVLLTVVVFVILLDLLGVLLTGFLITLDEDFWLLFFLILPLVVVVVVVLLLILPSLLLTRLLLSTLLLAYLLPLVD